MAQHVETCRFRVFYKHPDWPKSEIGVTTVSVASCRTSASDAAQLFSVSSPRCTLLSVVHLPCATPSVESAMLSAMAKTMAKSR